MNLAPVIDLLRERIGLDPDSLGASTLTRAVAARMNDLGLRTPAAYAARLADDAQEFQRLLGDVAVPETWFFRGGEVFAYLAARAAATLRLRPPGQKFRTLSVPCSTGEEPYSLAIALAEAAVSPADWEIDAVDISSAHLERARRGRFGAFSFRQTAPELRDRYFRPVEGGWELGPVLRSQVRFREGNLLDLQLPPGEKPFDLIFCRNLLIYLHADARRVALDICAKLLALDGWLCMGHADPVDHRDTRFVRAGPDAHFLYRRVARREVPIPILSEWHAPAEPARLQPPVPLPVQAPDTPPASVDLLGRARQMADQGRLAEALACCNEQLAQSGPSAALYSLMGVIYQAQKDREEAVRCYQRALYLERESVEALTHLMLLYQEQGDDAQAARLQRRLDRVSPGGEA